MLTNYSPVNRLAVMEKAAMDLFAWKIGPQTDPGCHFKIHNSLLQRKIANKHFLLQFLPDSIIVNFRQTRHKDGVYLPYGIGEED